MTRIYLQIEPMEMNRVDLYEFFGMDKYFDGDCFRYSLDNPYKSNEAAYFSTLDDICLKEGLLPLNGEWNRMNSSECSALLLSALKYDLAYTSALRMTEELAASFHKKILNHVDVKNCKCFTNWFNSPWIEQGNGSWNSISESTLDMAIVFVDDQNLVFTYFLGED